MGLNSLTFGNVNTLDYGVYILSDPTFNAPKRVYKTIEVPGRNGLVAIDEGYYENITITYPAYIKADTFEEFSEKVSDFRNALMSQSGYQRLYNTYHPDEYRMALFQDDFILDITKYLRTGRFDLTFDCKPQRYLVSGETAVSVASGDTITNLTAFPASPLLEVEGYGDITINDSTVSIQDSPLGWIDLANPVSKTYGTDAYLISDNLVSSFNNVPYYTGDMARSSATIQQTDSVLASGLHNISGVTVVSRSANIIQFSVNPRRDTDTGNMLLTFTAVIENVPFVTGNSGHVDLSAEVEIEYVYGTPKQYGTVTVQWSSRFDYSSTNVSWQTPTITYVSQSFSRDERISTTISIEKVKVASTYSSLGNPLYLDLENGQAYKYEGNEYISVNNAVWLGAELPVLKSGENTITYDSDVHDFKIVPRWWRI